MENKQAFYDIVKQYRGGLALTLPAFDSSVNSRRIDFKYNTNVIRVPRVYALGIFTDSSLVDMYENGYFTVEPNNIFMEDLKEILYQEVEVKKVYDTKTLRDKLIQGDRVFVRECIKDSVNRENLIIAAKENIGSISGSMIKDLEEMLKVELTVENE